MSDLHTDDVAASILDKIAEPDDGDDPGADTLDQSIQPDPAEPSEGERADAIDKKTDTAQSDGEVEGTQVEGQDAGNKDTDTSTTKTGEQSNSDIVPPVSWKADAKALFKQLTPALQKEISERESERERGVQQAARDAIEAKKAAEAQSATTQAERKQYAERLGRVLEVVNNLDPKFAEWQRRDWAKYADDDPLGAPKEWFKYQQQLSALKVAQQEKTIADEQVVRQQRVKAHDYLSEKLDFWKDDGKRKADQSALRDWAKTQGYSDEDVNGIEDGRSYITARKAMLYDKLMAEQSKIAAAKDKPPVAKQVMRSQGTDSSGNNPRADALSKRAAKTGRIDDMAAAVLAKLN